MESRDLPSIYYESDSLAIDAQKKHFRLIRAKIALVLAVGIVTSVTLIGTESYQTFEGTVLTIFLVLSIALTAMMYGKDFDKTWFDSRAIAESIKAETWLFMMKAPRYGGDISEAEAGNLFLNRLNEIIHSHQSVMSELTPYLTEGTQITVRMRQVRNQPLESRRGLYSRSRIHDQCIWYARKTKWNKTQESRWFALTWMLEISAVTLALVSIFFRNPIVSPIGIVSATSGGVLSWINARSYKETTVSYGLVAYELSILEDRTSQIMTEDDMSRIVMEAENAISSEQRIWLARLI